MQPEVNTVTCKPNAQIEMSWVTGVVPKQRDSFTDQLLFAWQSPAPTKEERGLCRPGCPFLSTTLQASKFLPNSWCPSQHFEANETTYNSLKASRWEADPWAWWTWVPWELSAWPVPTLSQSLPSSEVRPGVCPAAARITESCGTACIKTYVEKKSAKIHNDIMLKVYWGDWYVCGDTLLFVAYNKKHLKLYVCPFRFYEKLNRLMSTTR